MHCILPILLGLCALVSARCGTPQPSESIKALHAAYQAHEAASAKQPARRQAENAINTYFNVIVSGVSEDEGNIPQSWIDNQVSVTIIGPSLPFSHPVSFKPMKTTNFSVAGCSQSGIF